MRKDRGAGREGWSEHLRGVSSTVLKAVPLRHREMQSSREERSWQLPCLLPQGHSPPSF